jgi:hypothetical protein
VLLAAKAAFDLHILVKQHALLTKLIQGGLKYQVRTTYRSFEQMPSIASRANPIILQWDIQIGQYHHPIILIGTWSSLIILYLLNSYIFFMLGAGIVGSIVLNKVRT